MVSVIKLASEKEGLDMVLLRAAIERYKKGFTFIQDEMRQ